VAGILLTSCCLDGVPAPVWWRAAPAYTHYQFTRLGYYVVDKDSTPTQPTFNEVVELRESNSNKAAKAAKKGGGGGGAAKGGKVAATPTPAAPAAAAAVNSSAKAEATAKVGAAGDKVRQAKQDGQSKEVIVELVAALQAAKEEYEKVAREPWPTQKKKKKKK
jgi:hypothetical protein